MIPGFRVTRVERVGSTNDVAGAAARAGEPDGLVVVAGEQTAGRGRQGRRWLADPASSLTFSVLRRPTVPPAAAPAWTLLAGLACWEAAPGSWLKWPNDVMVGDGKAAGILCELELQPTLAVIVGVGVNLRVPPGGWPAEIATRAGAVDQTTDEFLERFLPALLRWELRLRAAGLGAVLPTARAAMGPLWGRAVTLQGGPSGIATDLDDSGRLVVVDGAGRRHACVAGDVHIGAIAPPPGP